MNRRRTEGLFRFVSKMPGTYAFVVSNNNWYGGGYFVGRELFCRVGVIL